MKKKSILVVENLDSERSELVEVLTAVGYKILEASNSDEALKTFTESNPDLVIVEVLIPGIGGLKVSKLIKEQAPEWVKIIVTSKVPQSVSIRDSATRKYKADGFLQKPFELSVLIKMVEELVGPGVRDSEEDAKKDEAKSEPPLPPRKPVREKIRIVEKTAATARPKIPEPETPSAQVPPSPAPAPVIEEKIPDKGEFTPPRFVKILYRLFNEAFTGALQAQGPRGAKQIFFIDGTPVFVQSNIREESLGRLLLEEGRIDQEEYRGLVEESAETGRKVGSLLIEKNLMSTQALTEYLCEQTAIKTASIFSWLKADYRIEPETIYPSNASTFEASPSKILLMGFQRYYPIELIEKGFEENKTACPKPKGNPIYADAEKYLTHRQKTFLGSLTTQTLGDAIAQADIGMLEALRLTFAFAAMERITFGGDGSRTAGKSAKGASSSGAKSSEPAIVKAVNDMASRMEDLNHFDLLGIDVDADPDKIESGYKFVKDAHSPDKLQPNAPGDVRRRAAAIAQRLEEARKTLLNPVSRRRYIARLVKMKTDDDDPVAAARKKKMSAELAFQRGLVNFQNKKFAMAAESFSRAAQADPSVPEYRARAGYSLFCLLKNREQLIKEAKELIAGAVRDDKENTGYLAWLAEMCREEGDTKTAARVYQQILELDPDHEEARRQLHYVGQTLANGNKKTKKSLFGRFK